MIDLRCGDCLTELDNIPDNSVIVSDPPFNIGYKYRTYKDRMKENEYFRFLSLVYRGGEDSRCHDSLSGIIVPIRN